MTSAAEFLRDVASYETYPQIKAQLLRLADDIDAVIPARGGQVAHGYHDALKRIRGEA